MPNALLIHQDAHSLPGLLPDLLATLNAQQSDYQFVLVPTSVTRRFRDFQSARYDLIMFESPTWGWQTRPMKPLICRFRMPRCM